MGRQLIREFIQLETEGIKEDIWMDWKQIKDIDKYKKIARNGREFHDYIDAGYLEGNSTIYKRREGGIRRLGSVKRSEIDALLKYLNKLESGDYISDLVFLPLLGIKQGLRNKTKSKKAQFLSHIFTVCDCESIQYIYFEQPINGITVYLKKDQFNHFLATHLSLKEAFQEFGFSYDQFAKRKKRYNIKMKFNRFISRKDLETYFKGVKRPPRSCTPSKPKYITGDGQEFDLQEDVEKCLSSVSGEIWLTWEQIQQIAEYKCIAVDGYEFNSYIDVWYLKGYFKVSEHGRQSYVNKSELVRFLKYLTEIDNEYMGNKEFFPLIGITSKSIINSGKVKRKNAFDIISSFCISEGIEYLLFDSTIKGNFFYMKRESFYRFLEANILSTDVFKKYDITRTQLESTVKKNGIKEKVFSSFGIRFFSKKDAEEFFSINPKCNANENVKERVSLDGELVYDTTEVCKILDIDDGNYNFTKILSDILTPVSVAFTYSGNFYLKCDVDMLLEELEQFKQKYCTAKETKNILVIDFKTSVLSPAVLTTRQELLKKIVYKNSLLYLFLRDDVYSLKKQRQEQEMFNQLFDTFENEPLEIFNSMLGIKQISFSEKSKFTEREWFSFCEERLPNYRGTDWNRKSRIKTFLVATEQLADFTQDKELYSRSSKELGFRFFKTDGNWAVQQLIWDFLSVFREKVIYYTEKNGKSAKVYEISKISKISPYKREQEKRKSQIKDIYSYDEFKAFYAFVEDMMHKKEAILDAEKIISGNEEECSHYASIWLFSLVHLTNAWRTPDILQIPEIDLDKIGVFSLETLKERDLTHEETTRVINQLCEKTYTITKTHVNHHFYCADDLELPIATAAVVCSIITRQSNRIAGLPIIEFGNKDNDYLTSRGYRSFFHNINSLQNLDDFSFRSRKMNRTVLVIIYVVLINKGKGSAAFKIAQKLRAHIDMETTNIYMQIPQQEMDRICSNLFSRRMFGYIPDLLASLLFGENENHQERTNEIIAINENFGDVYKIEATTGYINKVLAERQGVVDMIFKMGIDGALELMFNLNAGLLPAKEKDFQCIIAPKTCPYKERSCKNCHLSVSNFYTLSALVNEVEKKLINFLENYSPECYEGEKTHLLNILFLTLDNLERACQKFGKDEVMKFFDGGKERYNELYNKFVLIDDSTLSYDDIKKYTTYCPNYIEI